MQEDRQNSFTTTGLREGASTNLFHSILRTVLYFDLFSYPLTQEEVFANLQSDHVSKDQVAEALQHLTTKGILYRTRNFFSLQNDLALADRRAKGNELAASFHKIARRRGSLIYKFPFVRAVMISGSLSKGYADQQTDIDFFIITSSDRLWIARTFLVIFKRLFLFNSHKYFCVNYFLDEKHLSIEEQNLFTATELSTLIPLQGHSFYNQLMDSNAWIKEMLPHAEKKNSENKNEGTFWLKTGLEWLLNARWGNRLENYCMNLTLRRWQKIYSNKMPAQDFEIAFKTKSYVSKNHPDNYQQKIMDRYQSKLKTFIWP